MWLIYGRNTQNSSNLIWLIRIKPPFKIVTTHRQHTGTINVDVVERLSLFQAFSY